MDAPVGTVGKRRKYLHGDRTIYEWEQGLDEVNLFFAPPPGLPASEIECVIQPHHLRLGIKGNPSFIDEDLGGPVIVKESFWTLEDGEIHVTLQKMRKAETWASAFAGHAPLDPLAAQEEQRRILLQRFQEEHPGFDFSSAAVNGAVPDPRTFMEGVKYK